jgi:hypothetical protein
MAIQFSVDVRNAQLNQIEVITGASARLQIFSGAVPASCAAADNGTLLVDIALPADWMNDAASGSKAKSAAAWSAAAAAPGTAGHYRLKNSAGATTHEQGTVTASGGGGDLTLDNTSIGAGQTVTISTWTRSAGNA